MIGYGAWEAGGTAWGPNESEDGRDRGDPGGHWTPGIDWIDTAEVYGDGVSERLVGRAHRGTPGRGRRRDQGRPATRRKRIRARAGPARRARRASTASGPTGSTCISSIGRTRAGSPLEETWGAMAASRTQGRSDPSASRTSIARRSRRASRSATWIPCSRSSRCSTREHAELIRWCGEQGVGVVSYGPLAFGLLTGAITADTRFPPGDWRGEKQADGPFADLAGSLAGGRSAPSCGRAPRVLAVRARARLERPPARRHGRDRREPQPGARPDQRRRGRPRAGRGDARGAGRDPRPRSGDGRAGCTCRSLLASPSSRLIARAGSCLDQPVQRVSVEAKDLHRRVGHDRCGPGAAVQGGELTEEVSGDEGARPSGPREPPAPCR